MQRWSRIRAVLIGGSIAAVLDIAFAISYAYSQGTPPVGLLQAVASGVLGEASYSGGAASAALGLVLHFFLSYLFASAYVFASRRIEALIRSAFVCGVLYGIGVFLIMRLVVLPLSAFPHPVRFTSLGAILDLFSHMLLFGLPIALAARKTAPGVHAMPGAMH